MESKVRHKDITKLKKSEIIRIARNLKAENNKLKEELGYEKMQSAKYKAIFAREINHPLVIDTPVGDIEVTPAGIRELIDKYENLLKIYEDDM